MQGILKTSQKVLLSYCTLHNIKMYGKCTCTPLLVRVCSTDRPDTITYLHNDQLTAHLDLDRDLRLRLELDFLPECELCRSLRDLSPVDSPRRRSGDDAGDDERLRFFVFDDFEDFLLLLYLSLLVTSLSSCCDVLSSSRAARSRFFFALLLR